MRLQRRGIYLKQTVSCCGDGFGMEDLIMDGDKHSVYAAYQMIAPSLL